METTTSLKQFCLIALISIKVRFETSELIFVLTKSKGGRMTPEGLNTFERVGWKGGLENGVMQAASFNKNICLNRREPGHLKTEVVHCSFVSKRQYSVLWFLILVNITVNFFYFAYFFCFKKCSWEIWNIHFYSWCDNFVLLSLTLDLPVTLSVFDLEVSSLLCHLLSLESRRRGCRLTCQLGDFRAYLKKKHYHKKPPAAMGTNDLKVVISC